MFDWGVLGWPALGPGLNGATVVADLPSEREWLVSVGCDCCCSWSRVGFSVGLVGDGRDVFRMGWRLRQMAMSACRGSVGDVISMRGAKFSSRILFYIVSVLVTTGVSLGFGKKIVGWEHLGCRMARICFVCFGRSRMIVSSGKVASGYYRCILSTGREWRQRVRSSLA